MYCGSLKLYEQTGEYLKFGQLAKSVAALAGRRVSFTSVVRAIDDQNVVGYARGGYWSTHLARVVDPQLAGGPLLQPLTYGQECCKLLL